MVGLSRLMNPSPPLLGLELLCLTPFPIIFQLYHGDQFSRWKKAEYPEKTIEVLQITDKFYHIVLYEVHTAMIRI